MTKERYNELAVQIVNACFHVHRELGPGLLGSAYEFALLKEFELRNILVQNQQQVKLFYKGFDTGKYYVNDLLIENKIVLEIKCCDTVPPVYVAQIIFILKTIAKEIGLFG